MSVLSGLRVCVVDLNGPFGPLSSYVELNNAFETRNVAIEYLVPRSREASVGRRTGGHPVHSYQDERFGVLHAMRAIGRMEPRPDIVHANSTSAVPIAMATWLSLRIPFVVHLRNSKLSPGETRMLRLAVGSPFRSAAVAVSEYAGEISTLPRDKWCTVPDAVNAGPRRPNSDCGHSPSVGAVVNQTATKGLDILANVIAGSDDLNLIWRVFGSASDRDANDFVRLQRYHIDKSARYSTVDFRGVVPDLKLEFPALDAVVLTSRRESFSRVAVEAMLAGVPLVAPLVPGLTETIAGGEHASTYPVGDHSAACEALRGVFADYRLSLQRAARARTFADRRYAPGVVCDEVLRVYEKLLC